MQMHSSEVMNISHSIIIKNNIFQKLYRRNKNQSKHLGQYTGQYTGIVSIQFENLQTFNIFKMIIMISLLEDSLT